MEHFQQTRHAEGALLGWPLLPRKLPRKLPKKLPWELTRPGARRALLGALEQPGLGFLLEEVLHLLGAGGGLLHSPLAGDALELVAVVGLQAGEALQLLPQLLVGLPLGC